MRGADVQQLGMFSYVSVDNRVPEDHPIRKLRVLVDAILKDLDGLFEARYAREGRPSIPPERLLRASLLQVVYSVRSERLARTMGYAISQVVRKRIEQGFGWTKSIGGLRKLTRIGLQKVRAWTAWSFAAYNLIRIGGIENWWQPSPT